MGWDGAGNLTRLRNFSADASAGIKILASAMDQELNDFASAIGLCWTRNGQNVPTVDIPMGGKKFVNIGAPTSVNNYMRPRDFIENVPIYMLDTTTSADNISVSAEYFTSVSAGQSPVGGTKVLIKMASLKGSAPAIHLNAGGGAHSANVVMNDGDPLHSAAMVSGGIYEFVFASAASVWHLLNPSHFSPATETSAGIIEIATTAEVTAGTDTVRAVTPSTLDALLFKTGSFTGTLTGCTTSPTGTIYYTIAGNIVSMQYAGTSWVGTSNATTMTVTGAPAEVRTSASDVPAVPCIMYDNGTSAAQIGYCGMATGGTIVFALNGSVGGFTASGTKGVPEGWCITYPIVTT